MVRPYPEVVWSSREILVAWNRLGNMLQPEIRKPRNVFQYLAIICMFYEKYDHHIDGHLVRQNDTSHATVRAHPYRRFDPHSRHPQAPRLANPAKKIWVDKLEVIMNLMVPASTVSGFSPSSKAERCSSACPRRKERCLFPPCTLVSKVESFFYQGTEGVCTCRRISLWGHRFPSCRRWIDGGRDRPSSPCHAVFKR